MVLSGNTGEGIITTADTSGIVRNIPDSTWNMDSTAVMHDIFGASSELADGIPSIDNAAREWALTGNPVYSVIVILCLCAYCLLIYRFRNQAFTLANLFRGKLYVNKLLDEQNFTFETFLRLLIILGMALTGISAIKLTDTYLKGQAAALPGWTILILPAITWILLMAVWFYQNISLKIAGWLSANEKLTSHLKSLRRLIIGLSLLLLSPVMMFFSLADEAAAQAVLWVLAAGASVLFIFLLFRTYMLFMQQKISILYWFLYLCTVEIFPLSFLVLLALKNI